MHAATVATKKAEIVSVVDAALAGRAYCIAQLAFIELPVAARELAVAATAIAGGSVAVIADLIGIEESVAT
ncbi:MAG: hypothetical protein Tsb0020_22250 [Haliangiales bacterium]